MAIQVIKKSLFVNQTVFTLKELLQCTLSEKRSAIHQIQVEGHYQRSFFEVDEEVFEPLPDLYTHQQINEFTEKQVNEALKIVFNRLIAHEESLIVKTERLHIPIGKEIYQVSRKLKFSGEFRLSKGKLLGFVESIGNWNDFNVNNVKLTINFLHVNAPRKNYGKNNYSTGELNHQWSIKDDYIFMDFDYNRKEAVHEIETWFKTVQHHVKELSKADSVRLQVDDADDGASYVRLVLWWD
jgi:hypothetical protein